MRPPRNHFIDLIKTFLITLVVIGHMFQFGLYRNSSFWDDPLFKFIYMFHMPLFMGVAGYLSRGSIDNTSIGILIRKKAAAYLVPAIVWPMVFRIALALVTARFGSRTVALAIISDVTDALWFLWALFFSILITALIRYLNFDRFGFAYFISFLAVLAILEAENVPVFKYTVIMLKYTYPFFQAGYLLAKAKAIPDAMRRTSSLAIAFVVSLICYSAWTNETFIYNSGMRLSMHNLPSIFLRYIAGFSLSFLVLRIAYEGYLKLREPVPRWATHFGQDSIAIYILQGYAFLLISKLRGNRGVIESGIFGWFAAIAGGIAICWITWLLGRFVMRSAFFDRVLFGRTKIDGFSAQSHRAVALV